MSLTSLLIPHFERKAAELRRKTRMRKMAAAEVVEEKAGAHEAPAAPRHGYVHCPRCGRELKKQGAHFHVKACKA